MKIVCRLLTLILAALLMFEPNTGFCGFFAPFQVFARNTAGDLIDYGWVGGSILSWSAENLTTGRSNIGTQFRLASDPVVVNLLQDGSTKEWSQRVFGRSSKGDLIHYHWSPSTSWSAENLTTGWPDTGTQFRFVSDPVTLDCPNLDEEGRAYCTFPNF
ncbi:MAG: hypothetical protein KDI73_04655 [Candidatus Competibacteraceae bacterium]|nr:hypothetical protein [Candidatus Competibacteraceae bacterium]